MANSEHLTIVKRGVEAWNSWRAAHPSIAPNLSKADLSGLRLDKANLRGADLTKASLRRAVFWNAILEGADLSGANLMFADFRDAKLRKVNLQGANLRAALLIRTRLPYADLRKADLAQANLSFADLSNADLRGAELYLTNLVGVNLRDANLSGAYIYGVSAWGLKIEGADQQGLIVTRRHEPTITVDDIEVAQFVYLLLHNDKIRQVIDTVTAKMVLILGRFTLERKVVLDAVREELRKYDLVPVIFDFEQPRSKDLHETVTTLARLSRFIIADITDPKSIPQELISVVESLPSVPVQPVIEKGSEPWAMFDHIKRYPWVLKIHQYTSVKHLLDTLGGKVIGPAEAKAKKLIPRVRHHRTTHSSRCLTSVLLMRLP